MPTSDYRHTPVLLKEVIDLLAPKPGGIYFDGTLGGGGYAEAILNASPPDGKVFGVDIDEDAILAAKERLARFGWRAVIERASYADIAEITKHESRTTSNEFDGMVLDLGVSSHQFDAAERGFSFSKEAKLDMRMDKRLNITAADIVNTFSADELEEIFKEYGEERFARKIAVKIIAKRGEKKIGTTSELEEICYLSYPPNLRRGRIHPATKVFQALRIKVNGELENLGRFLADSPPLLKKGGIIVVVSYHSLEDGMVKRAFRRLAEGGGFKLLTKKPATPSAEEIDKNPRARSAKLRAVISG